MPWSQLVLGILLSGGFASQLLNTAILEINHNGSIHMTKINKSYRAGLLLFSESWFIHLSGKLIRSCLFVESESGSVVSSSLRPHGLYSPFPWNSPWNSPSPWNTGVGGLSLLQGIFPTQGSNPGLPHCRWILYQLSHKGSPRILEWVAYPFLRGSS